jgi:hypothetical protein
MSTVSDIHKGLAANLRTIRRLRVADHIPEGISPPMAVLALERVEYRRQMAGGLNEYTFSIVVAVGRMGERTGQIALDEYLAPVGSRSILAAAESDPTLGGVAHDVTVVSAGQIQPLTVGDAAYLTVEFNAIVRA